MLSILANLAKDKLKAKCKFIFPSQRQTKREKPKANSSSSTTTSSATAEISYALPTSWMLLMDFTRLVIIVKVMVLLHWSLLIKINK
jgi:hypothetical protein